MQRPFVLLCFVPSLIVALIIVVIYVIVTQSNGTIAVSLPATTEKPESSVLKHVFPEYPDLTLDNFMANFKACKSEEPSTVIKKQDFLKCWYSNRN